MILKKALIYLSFSFYSNCNNLEIFNSLRIFNNFISLISEFESSKKSEKGIEPSTSI